MSHGKNTSATPSYSYIIWIPYFEPRYAAVMEYWEQLQPMCIAKPEPYAERKKRREAEIAGLKEALTILEEEAGSAFLPMFILTPR